MPTRIPVVDLFAGPGGLGEGFASFQASPDNQSHPFRIVLSAEMEWCAYRTLRLRSFFRAALTDGGVPESYYAYVSGEAKSPWDASSKALWEHAKEEARRLEIGSKSGTRKLRAAVAHLTKGVDPWVLIGGPPCQAYSLVGRARNSSVEGYKPETDKRHFLYKHYLNIIREFQPAVFVMENVKGILSSKVEGSLIFNQILSDLHDPGNSQPKRSGRTYPKYKIRSLAIHKTVFEGKTNAELDPYDFVVPSENYGIPQARHRVILVGIREDLDIDDLTPLTLASPRTTVSDAISDLPPLRSGLSEGEDNFKAWKAAVLSESRRAMKASRLELPPKKYKALAQLLWPIRKGALPYESRGGMAVKKLPNTMPESPFLRQLADANLKVVLNHASRSHMNSDLGRYLFTAAYGQAHNYSPKAKDFPEQLAPDHDSWGDGFLDRFRVQLAGAPATTVTSHIAKDGHYYIHSDAQQCRSLTVREAARLQTFPDNYFFEGNRTEQYTQVGNAVPPGLASQIAQRIWTLLNKTKG